MVTWQNLLCIYIYIYIHIYSVCVVCAISEVGLCVQFVQQLFVRFVVVAKCAVCV